MNTNPLVRVQHPGIEGKPLVPKAALKSMSPKWRIVDDQVEADAAPQPKTPGGKSSPAKKSPRKRATNRRRSDS